MCYLLAKRFDSTGSLALQTAHGQHLAEFASARDAAPKCISKRTSYHWV